MNKEIEIINESIKRFELEIRILNMCISQLRTRALKIELEKFK